MQREDAAREQSLMLGLILLFVVVAAQSVRWTVVIGLVAKCCLGHFTFVLWQPGIRVTALLVLGGRARCTCGQVSRPYLALVSLSVGDSVGGQDLGVLALPSHWV